MKYTDGVLCVAKSLLLTFKLRTSCRDEAEREAPMFWSDLDLQSGKRGFQLVELIEVAPTTAHGLRPCRAKSALRNLIDCLEYVE